MTYFLGSLLLLIPAAEPAEKPRTIQLASKFLETTETIRVWTPPGYAADAKRRYPVIYCCQNTGIPVRQLTKLMTAGDFPPFVLVNYEGPSRGGEHAAGAAWSDKRQPSGSFFRKELIPWVDANYRTVPTHKGRVLIGCSKAGGGVMHLGLKYPDLFGAIVSLDGALALYDNAGKGLNYAKDGDSYLQLIEKQGDTIRNTPILLIEGSWFWKTGREYLSAFRQAGLKEIEVIDARDLGHGVDTMFERHLPEILTVFGNCVSGAEVTGPRINPPGGVFIAPVQVALAGSAPGMKLYYTTDGSDPTQLKHEYKKPLTLNQSIQLRVVGVLADGKQVTRQRLVRFDFPTPAAPDTERGKSHGLVVEVIAGHGGKRDLAFLREAWDGKAKGIYQGESSSFTISEDAAKKIPAGEYTVLFKGVLSIPETRVYQIQVTGDSTGLFLDDGKGGLLQLLRTVGGGDATVEKSVALAKGSYRIVGVNRWPEGRHTFRVRLRNATGEFVPFPELMLSH